MNEAIGQVSETSHGTRRFALRCLSPVHVGTGEVLEFHYKDGKTYVLDMEAVFSSLPPEDVRRGAFSDAAHIVGRHPLPLESLSLHPPISGRPSARSLRQGIRDGGGRPLIPGSSLKGAIRTAFLAQTVTEADLDLGFRGMDRDPKRAARAFERLMRPRAFDDPNRFDDPKFDAFRALVVRDATFSPGSLAVRSATVHGSATNFGLAVEALEPGAEATLEMSLLSNLLTGDFGRVLGFEKLKLEWPTLRWRAREHALAHIKREVQAFGQLGLDAGHLHQIRATIEEAPGSIPLRLGWGIGWNGTTGTLASTKELRLHLLQKFDNRSGNRMGKYSSGWYRDRDLDFPKTRRLTPALETFGWVLLTPDPSRSTNLSTPLTRPEPKRLTPSPLPGIVTQPSAQPQVFLALEQLKPNDIKPRMSQLVQEAESLKPALRTEFAKAALARIEKEKLRRDVKDKPYFAKLDAWSREGS